MAITLLAPPSGACPACPAKGRIPMGACAIIRGLRAVSDFDYEYAMYQVNAELNPNIETVFLLAASEYSFLSSTIIKELARYGKGLDKYTPPIVSKALLDKFKNKKL